MNQRSIKRKLKIEYEKGYLRVALFCRIEIQEEPFHAVQVLFSKIRPKPEPVVDWKIRVLERANFQSLQSDYCTKDIVS